MIRQTCAFCGAETILVHKFMDELQCLELDEAMALSERQECPFLDKAWHREVEMLEAAAGCGHRLEKTHLGQYGFSN